ncbi:MAG: type II toxin-antitoxin system HicA family toxin [Acidimicrobiales bacterium]
MNPAGLLRRIVGGAVVNVSFADLVSLLEALGFEEIGGKGSHRVFARPGVTELVNLQEVQGQAKPYQVRQVAGLVRRYDLHLESES